MLRNLIYCTAMLFLFCNASLHAQLKLPKIKNKEVKDAIDLFGGKKKKEKRESGGDNTGGSRDSRSNPMDIFAATPKTQDLAGKWAGKLTLGLVQEIDFEMRVNVEGDKVHAIAEYKTAYGNMKYLLEGTANRNEVTLYEKEVLEQGPGSSMLILAKKKYFGACIYYNNKLQLKGRYEPDGQFYYKDKVATPSDYEINGSTFKLMKVDEEKILNEFGNYIYTKEKDEEEYLRRMMIYFADNKYYNYHRKCDPETFRYRVLTRDKNGLFTKVLGKYFEVTSNNQRVENKDSTEILVSFSNGVPYRIGYPKAESLPETAPWVKGEIGKIDFPEDEQKRLMLLNREDNRVRDSVFEEGRKRAQLAIEKKIAQYGSFDCSSCFERSERIETSKVTVRDVDDRGFIVEHEEDASSTYVTYRNKCSQMITVVGVQRIGTTNKGAYYTDISMSLKPGEQITLPEIFANLFGVNFGGFTGKFDPQFSRQYIGVVGKNKVK